jgi:hypothetical protein
LKEANIRTVMVTGNNSLLTEMTFWSIGIFISADRIFSELGCSIC